MVASIAAKRGEPYIAAYTASKHGVLGLVRSVAAELATTGVTVNAVCPGYVDTPMTDATVRPIAARTGRTAAEARAVLEAKQPIGRLITVDEVAGRGLLPGRRFDQRSSDRRRGAAVMTLERVNPPELAAPSGFSARRGRRGRSCSSPARPRWTPGTRSSATDRAQFEQALTNLLAALQAAGGEPEHLAKVTIFTVDIPDYRAHAREIGAVWHRLVGRDYPAMALIGIVRLWDQPALVELEGIAVLPD